MNWPEAQKNAQGEIDRVIGPDRIPVVQDIDDLPYVQALIKEVFPASCLRLRLLCLVLILFIHPDSSLETDSPVGVTSCDDTGFTV